MAEKTELEIELLLPDVHDSTDGCVQRLTDLISARKGIDRVHVRQVDGDGSDRLCVHFDPSEITVGEIRRFARQSGSDLGKRYGHLLLMTHAMPVRRARQLNVKIESVPGVLDAGVSADGVVRIEFDRHATNVATIEQQVDKMGVPVSRELALPETTAVPAHRECDHHHGGIFGENTELIFAILSGVCLLIGWTISVTGLVNDWVPWGFYAASCFLGGFFIVQEAIDKTLSGRFEIDFLMIVAAIGAAILGNWAEGALLLFLFSMGHALEHYAMGRARKAIEALADLAPDTALVRRDGNVIDMPVEQLQLGDTVIVKTNERIAADGFVIAGESSVDQSPITGESVPVDKRPVIDPAEATRNPQNIADEQRVFAGTINQAGSLEIRVTRLAQESTLARVITMVNEAETQTSPTQQFTDRFERCFVPAVLGMVLLLHFAFLVVDESFADSFYRAMAVLVAASPCALAISTPSAVLSGIARSARGGVLVKGGGPLENLGRLSAIAFDKTGTLTEGKPRLVDVVPFDGTNQEELLRLAIAVEKLSDHPLAAAVVQDGSEILQQNSLPTAVNLRSFTGRGIAADVEAQTTYIGKPVWFAEMAGAPIPTRLQSTIGELELAGRTLMVVRRGEQYLGVLGLMDTPRTTASATIQRLRELGIKRMIMISGDNQFVANAVAKEVGIDEARGDLLPNDKVEAIRNLRQEHPVAMVGDGVNDAPAMANATVGIAMGAAGSDVALETADIALMSDELGRLPFAVGLSRQTSRVIRQNLWFSLGMVAVLVPATIFGLPLGWAVVFHEGSTIVVVINALRLLAYRDRS